MPVFPPAPPVTVTVNGQRLAAYVRARVVDGRIYAPLALLRPLVDRMWLEGRTLVVERNGMRARMPMALRFFGNLDVSSVAMAPLLQALGDRLIYQPVTRTLDVRTPPPRPIASATPFSGTPQPPRTIFTPEPVPTPRPVWSGSPLPRRTPLPGPP